MTFVKQEWPEKDPAALAEFYYEPQRRKKENERYRKEVLDVAFDAIDLTALAAVKKGSRVRGEYDREARLFLAQEDEDGNLVPAGRISLTEGTFEGKEYNTVLQGFRTSANKDEFKDKFLVIGKKDEEGVYLVRTVS